MESFNAAAAPSMDDLLDFSSDIGEEDDSFDDNNSKQLLLPEFAEEDLEWISNKDAFPALETFMGVLPEEPPSMVSKHYSPVSVLENSNSSSSSNGSSTVMTHCVGFQVPVKPRSNIRRKRRRVCGNEGQQQCLWGCSVVSNKGKGNKSGGGGGGGSRQGGSVIGRKCLHCGAEKTPQWRAGPMGPKTLCNACGVRFKSGRLVPEYRPASSPTFVNELHSNSHRKIMEMRRQKQMPVLGKGAVEKG